MGNSEIIKKHDIQYTSAGTGIYHSEFNRNPSKSVHLLQIWFLPNLSNLKPKYEIKHIPKQEKIGTLKKIFASNKETDPNCITINSNVNVYCSILMPSVDSIAIDQNQDQIQNQNQNQNQIEFRTSCPKVYIHVCEPSGPIELNENTSLNGGDGAFIERENLITIRAIGNKPSEFLLFELF
eukprot:TRINITY_DN906_c1_g2_i1.p1 TRINITY_DN906_c1_g2~~TRINITY_DN906_c1_g2_i1.p1  ORF type:complete len:181 (-),score=61.17 TRINITY_DN906_c1_g2_i1:27-569(-)